MRSQNRNKSICQTWIDIKRSLLLSFPPPSVCVTFHSTHMEIRGKLKMLPLASYLVWNSLLFMTRIADQWAFLNSPFSASCLAIGVLETQTWTTTFDFVCLLEILTRIHMLGQQMLLVSRLVERTWFWVLYIVLGLGVFIWEILLGWGSCLTGKWVLKIIKCSQEYNFPRRWWL